ncbi:MAG: zinc ribbon domain-containing protein [Thermodesulfovibrionales bacterium]
MPIYEYMCNACSEKFSLLQSYSAAGDGAECPKCASKETRKIISAFCCSSANGGSDAGADAGFGGGCSSSGHSHGSGGGG